LTGAAAVLLTPLDSFPTPGNYAVDLDGVLWLELAAGVWGRGCVAGQGRHVFLRPAWALSWPPLLRQRFTAAESPTERSLR
jgi:hypothetical protein